MKFAGFSAIAFGWWLIWAPKVACTMKRLNDRMRRIFIVEQCWLFHRHWQTFFSLLILKVFRTRTLWIENANEMKHNRLISLRVLPRLCKSKSRKLCNLTDVENPQKSGTLRKNKTAHTPHAHRISKQSENGRAIFWAVIQRYNENYTREKPDRRNLELYKTNDGQFYRYQSIANHSTTALTLNSIKLIIS